jgi:putative membrane protein insertion efficiency factor
MSSACWPGPARSRRSRRGSSGMRWLALRAIRLYQRLLSPYFAGACRFTPSCSQYAREAIERHGLPHGVFLTARRLLRCHPLARSGYDPVP